MGTMDDPFEILATEADRNCFEELAQPQVARASVASVAALGAAVTARLHGFALDDSPVLSAVPQLLGELVPARTTVALRREHVGATVVIVFEGTDVRRPIVLGVLRDAASRLSESADREAVAAVVADDERYEITAQREIVLRCGDASITLTRAGKVLIKGRYIVSASTGYNKIKGAAVDIN